MECRDAAVSSLSWALIVGGAAYMLHQSRSHTQYGRYLPEKGCCCPARLGWFLQEVPAFLLPLLLLLTGEPEKTGDRTGRTLLLCTFMLHYFHRSFIYAFLTRGRPVPLPIVLAAAIFCSLNGFLQGHHLLHCAHFEHTWLRDARLAAGFLLFVVGMIINIHSDHILRSLRRPGETVYKIPYETTSRGLRTTPAPGRLSFLSSCDHERQLTS
ncbi:3-oxo-5-alpha-steroid 4-dehydrogenase 2-like isoform X2 [Cyclopterus lumpus]|uniref:3-oxo-5-alpha-steroid 4-dehydrogenase 2-like isoform X2 n=1 Tax=Cyclopterus lumpus TaxID=8103 RepID=UPI001485F127|nr:3-oxo-5-alpha-steroid 4-dehydrogenase 2-like isoform X2 [Cyclopterus lumpus]